MTDHGNPSVHENDPSVQVYFDNEFANDSQFPLEPGGECVAWIEGGSVVICPLDRLEDLPGRLDGPPAEAVPANYRDCLPSGPSFDPDLVPDGDSDDDRSHGSVASEQTDTDHSDP